jgi:putative transposase
MLGYYITMKRTVSIPIDIPPDRFLPLMEACSCIFNEHVDWAMENDTYNKSKAHKALYQPIKGQYPTIPTAFIQSVRDTAMEAVKATKGKKKPRKKRYSGIRFDRRTMSLRGRQLSLSCIGKRERVILDVPKYFEKIVDTWNLKGATLTYTVSKKQFWIRLVYEIETPPVKPGGKVVGVDRGLKHLAVTSDGQFFSNSTIRANQRRYLHSRQTLQAKGTPAARRRLKAMSGKEKRFSRDVNHQVSKKLANLPDVMTIVLEDLEGIRNKRRGKKLNKHLSSWPFHQFALFLEYKAEYCGKEVRYVDARFTSQKCSCCKSILKVNRNKSQYKCRRCDFWLHSDWNAAINIRDDYVLSSACITSEEQAAVNPPLQGRSTNYEVSLNVSAHVSDTSLQPCAVGN